MNEIRSLPMRMAAKLMKKYEGLSLECQDLESQIVQLSISLSSRREELHGITLELKAINDHIDSRKGTNAKEIRSSMLVKED